MLNPLVGRSVLGEVRTCRVESRIGREEVVIGSAHQSRRPMIERSAGADAPLDAIDRAMIGLLVENAPRRPVTTRKPLVTVLHVGACMLSEIRLR